MFNSNSPLTGGRNTHTHYCTHNCQVKQSKSKRLSDTVQFQHKRITNPSITHADKVMHALADCVEAIQGMMGKDRHSPATKDLQQLIDATQAQIKAQPNRFEHTATHTDTPPMQRVSRVQPQQVPGVQRRQICPYPTMMLTDR